MRIGIIIKPLRLFSNGLAQNAFFLYEVFRLCAHTCTFLCYDPTYTQVEGTDAPVQTVSYIMDETTVSAFDILLTVGHGVTPETYATCQRMRVRVVSFVCGNMLANTMIGFIDRTESTPSALVGKSTPADHVWIIGGHSYMKSFVELTRGAPTTLVPHLWSPRLLESYTETIFKRKKADLQYVHDKKESQYNILVLEPNLEFVKNAVIPITICERLHTLDSTAIREVFVFNFPDTSKTACALVDQCSIRSKIRRFKGLHIAEILTYFNAQPYPYIVVSHQINNPWNYLYYEMLHFGVPLVHNSDAFKSHGYYYGGCDIDQGADAIRNAIRYHARLKPLHGKKNAAFLTSIDPYIADCQNIWDALLAGVPACK